MDSRIHAHGLQDPTGPCSYMFLGCTGCSLNKVLGHPLTDLFDTVSFISAMDHSILDIPRLPLQSVRRSNTLFPRFEKRISNLI